MRTLKYRLTDGTVVMTMKEAQTSGQGYTAFMEKISEESSPLSPMREAMFEQFGYVSPTLKDEVTM